MSAPDSIGYFVELGEYSLILARTSLAQRPRTVEELREVWVGDSAGLDAALKELNPQGEKAKAVALLRVKPHMVFGADVAQAKKVANPAAAEDFLKQNLETDGSPASWAWVSQKDGRAPDGNSPWLLDAAPKAAVEEVLAKITGWSFDLLRCQSASLSLIGGVAAASKSAGATVLVCDITEARSFLSVVSAQGVSGFGTVAAGFDALAEATQGALGLKFRGSAARLLFNESYDFTDSAGKIVEPLANAVRAALPSLGASAPTHLVCGGILGRQAWMVQALATALGLKPFAVDAASAASSQGVTLAGKVGGDVAPAWLGILNAISSYDPRNPGAANPWNPILTQTPVAAAPVVPAIIQEPPAPAPAPAPAPKPPTPAVVITPPVKAPEPVPAIKPEPPKPAVAPKAPEPAPAPKPAVVITPPPKPVEAPKPVPPPAKAPPPPAKPVEQKAVAKAPEPKPTPAPAPKPVAKPEPAKAAAPTPAPAPAKAALAPAPTPPTPKTPAPAAAPAAAPKKKGPMPMIIGLVALLLVGGGGFYFYSEGQKAKEEQMRRQRELEQRAAAEAAARRLAEENARKEMEARKKAEEEAAQRAVAAEQARIRAEEETRRATAEQLLSARGHLNLNTDPAGATVVVGELAPRTSPVSMRDLRLGRYSITISMPGYDTETREIEIKASETTDLGTVALRRQVGSVDVTSDPANLEFELKPAGVLFVNPSDVRRGQTPAKLDGIPAGNYTLTITRPSWSNFVSNVTVERNGTATVHGTFVGATIVINSNPTGATVMRDQVQIGTTPLTLNDVQPGDVTFTLTQRGLEPAVVSGKAEGGKTLTLTGTLLDTERVMKLSELDERPIPIQQVEPDLPGNVRSEGGSATIEFVVGKDGVPGELRVVNTSNPAFGRACLSAAAKWKFRPGYVRGKAVRTRMILPFRMNPER